MASAIAVFVLLMYLLTGRVWVPASEIDRLRNQCYIGRLNPDGEPAVYVRCDSLEPIGPDTRPAP